MREHRQDEGRWNRQRHQRQRRQHLINASGSRALDVTRSTTRVLRRGSVSVRSTTVRSTTGRVTMRRLLTRGSVYGSVYAAICFAVAGAQLAVVYGVPGDPEPSRLAGLGALG